MTNKTPREQLLALADFMVEDIMAMSDEEVLAEVTPEEIEETRRKMLEFIDSLTLAECVTQKEE